MYRVQLSLCIALCACGTDDSASGADAAVTQDAANVSCTEVYDVAAPADAPYGLAITPAWVYWTTALLNGPKTVRRAPLAGGAAQTIADTTDDIAALAVDDAGSVFWIEAVPSSGGGKVMTMSADGTVTTVHTVAAGNWLDAFGIAVDATHVYWVIHDTSTGPFTDRLFSASKDGQGTATELGSATMSFATNVRRLMADDNALYWGYSGGTVYRAPRSGGATSTVVSESDGIGDFAVNGGHVYFIVQDTGGTVARVAAAGGTREVLVADTNARYGLAVHNNHVYASTRDSRIIAVPRTGGDAVVVQFTDIVTAGAIAVDEQFLFWANSASQSAGGAVRRICNPNR